MRTFLVAVWLAALVIGVFCMSLFLQGKVRDRRTGQPDVAIDLSAPLSSSREFRLWRGGQYDLALSSVNHTPPFDVPFRGTLEVSLTAADGRELLRRVVDSSSTPHLRPNNMSWTQLDSIQLESAAARKMRLSARVLDADPQFSGVRSTVHLRLRQYDPGMGGMMNYVMLVPGILFLAVAVGTAAIFAQKAGGPTLLRLTIAMTLLLGAAVFAL